MRIDEHIIYQDENIIAINKPSGLLTIPDREAVPGLRNYLQDKFGAVFTVHRLDRDTSGVVVFARNEQWHKHLSQQFEARETKKIYNGLALGTPAQKEGVVNEPIAEHPGKKGVMVVYK